MYYILGVYYTDVTMLLSEFSYIIHRYGGVRILNTFDSTGNIETHIERVITNRNPHFNGAGDDNEHDCTHV